MMNKPMISVIVPVYNAEKYLHKCIDSILAQTYSNFELLLIDDGSKDHSHEICVDFSKKDERIKVLNKRNGGVSTARNLGLDTAAGDWVTFVDADDTLSRDFLAHLVTGIDECVSLVVSNCDVIMKGKVYQSHVTLKNTTVSGNQMLIRLLKGDNVRNEVWAKLFRRSFIGNERFSNEIVIGEDLLFLLTCCYAGAKDKIRFVPYPDYHYALNDLSAMGKNIDRTYEYEKLITETTYRLKSLENDEALSQFVLNQIWTILDRYHLKQRDLTGKYNSLIDKYIKNIKDGNFKNTILKLYSHYKILGYLLYFLYKIINKLK